MKLVLDILKAKNNLVIKLFCFVLIVTFVTSIININFEVANYRLDRSIENLEEEKSILRAQYLSETSMKNLDNKASALKMSELSNKNCIKLSKPVQETKFKILRKNHLDSQSIALESKAQRYISGF